MPLPAFLARRPTARRVAPLRPLALLATLALGSTACDDATAPDAGDGRVARVEVTPARRSLASGETLQLLAVARDAAGREVAGKRVRWQASDELVAALDADGRLVARGHGTARVTAEIDGTSGTAELTVAANPVPQVTELEPASVRAGTERVTVVLRGSGFARGAVVRLDGQDRPTRLVGWHELQVDLAAGDLATARAAELSVVTPAPGGGTSAAARLVVSAIPVAALAIAPSPVRVAQGGTVELVATARDAAGAVLPGRLVAWRSADPAIAAVTATGTLAGLARGTTTVTASTDGVTATVSVTVDAPSAAPVIRAVEPAIAAAGDPATEVRIVGWNFTEETVATWNGAPRPTRVVDAGVVVVTLPAGDLAVATEGRLAVRTAGGVASGDVTFPVTAAATRLTLRGATPMWAGNVQQLAAVVTDALGRVLPNRPVTWSSSREQVALVDRAGLVLGVADGRATIRAAAGALSAELAIDVWPRPAQDVIYEMERGGRRSLAIVQPGSTDGPRWLLDDARFAVQPAVSPDGRRIAFVGRDAAGDLDVYVVDRDGTTVRRLTTAAGTDRQPAWSRDGTQLAFVSERSGLPQVWTMRADGSEQRQVTGLVPTFGDIAHTSPAWLADGRLVAEETPLTMSPLRSRLVVVRADGSDLRVLTDRAGYSDATPAVSPDGREIAFARRALAGGTWQLDLVDPDGRAIVTIDDLGPGRRPAWSADGRWLAFVDANGGIAVTRPRSGGARARLIEALAEGTGEMPAWLAR